MKIVITENQFTYIVEAYSEGLVNKLLNRYREESGGLDDSDILYVIKRFDTIKQSDKIKDKDITKYSWDDLSQLIYGYKPDRIKAGKVEKDDLSDKNLVYNQNGLRIYKGFTLGSCIRYGHGYRFCISSRGDENHFERYAYEEGGKIYFIFDDTKSFEKNSDGTFIDPTHLLVLVWRDKKEYDDELWDEIDEYTVVDANNKNENTYATFGRIEKEYPRLAGLEDIFTTSHSKNREDYYNYEKNKKLYKLEQEYNLKITKTRFNTRIYDEWERPPGEKYHQINKYNQFYNINDSQKYIDRVLSGELSKYQFYAKVIRDQRQLSKYKVGGFYGVFYSTKENYTETLRENVLFEAKSVAYPSERDKVMLSDFEITVTKFKLMPESYYDQIKHIIKRYKEEVDKINRIYNWSKK